MEVGTVGAGQVAALQIGQDRCVRVSASSEMAHCFEVRARPSLPGAAPLQSREEFWGLKELRALARGAERNKARQRLREELALFDPAAVPY